MNQLIFYCLSKQRAVLFIFIFILVGGWISYVSIPKESFPDVKIPYINISIIHEGISADDAETLLLKPLEENLTSLSRLKEMSSTAYEGGANVTLEFQAGFNNDKALQETRINVDKAKSMFPLNTKEPLVSEINLSLFPVLLIKLSGNLPERTLYKIAENLKEVIKNRVPNVLSANIIGSRTEVVEILISPENVENYGLLNPEVLLFFTRNNTLVNAGNLTLGSGNFSLKVSGLFKTIPEILKTPLVSNENFSLAIEDVAEIRKTYKEPLSIARDRGKPTVAIEISKRVGKNIIETIENIQKIVENEKVTWPPEIQISYAQDTSQQIRDMLKDLKNEIISALVFVMFIICISLGLRSSILVGIAIPGSFLAGILALLLMNYTINIVILFSLILSIGMLVDGAIVVVEYANRKIFEGASCFEAYKEAAQRMSSPVISSTITIIVAFLPLLFWPGVVGQFMKYLPITLIVTLIASILMALIFIPTIGIIFGASSKNSIKIKNQQTNILLRNKNNFKLISELSRVYVIFLNRCLNNPLKPLLISIAIFFIVVVIYIKFGKGVEFFPDVEPDSAIVIVHARGNLSIYEKDKLIHLVEERILHMKELKSIYTSVGNNALASSNDAIGTINLEFIEWKNRRKADEILKDIIKHTSNIPGIIVETQKQQGGPSQGKPIVIDVSSRFSEYLPSTLSELKKILEETEGLIGIEDNSPVSGIEWEFIIDRAEASKYGADITIVGMALQLITQGIKFGTYRPEDALGEVDIVVRFPLKDRTLERLKTLHITTNNGNIPLSNFMKQIPRQRMEVIQRISGKRTFTLKADVLPNIFAINKIKELKNKFDQKKFIEGIDIRFKGEDQDQQETLSFLIKAFSITICLIAFILVVQFNSFFSMLLILSSVIFSTIGVFVGLLVMQQPFGIVMGGIGIIALSGIIVSNNIIFLDTFDCLKLRLKSNYIYNEVRDIILETAAQRLRPVILTKLTIVLGLLPIMFKVSIDYMDFSIQIGAPSTQWWTILSTTIVFGVLFASPITLILTPSILMLKEKSNLKRKMVCKI